VVLRREFAPRVPHPGLKRRRCLGYLPRRSWPPGSVARDGFGLDSLIEIGPVSRGPAGRPTQPGSSSVGLVWTAATASVIHPGRRLHPTVAAPSVVPTPRAGHPSSTASSPPLCCPVIPSTPRWSGGRSNLLCPGDDARVRVDVGQQCGEVESEPGEVQSGPCSAVATSRYAASGTGHAGRAATHTVVGPLRGPRQHPARGVNRPVGQQPPRYGECGEREPRLRSRAGDHPQRGDGDAAHGRRA